MFSNFSRSSAAIYRHAITATGKGSRATFRTGVKLRDSADSFPALRVDRHKRNLSNIIDNWLLNEIRWRYLRSRKKELLNFCRKIPKVGQTVWTLVNCHVHRKQVFQLKTSVRIQWGPVFATVLRYSKLQLWDVYFIYFKFTPLFF